MPTTLEKSKKEVLSELVELLEDHPIEIRLGYDCTQKHTYASVSIKGSKKENDYIIKPVVEYVESFNDVERIVSNFLAKDVAEFAGTEF